MSRVLTVAFKEVRIYLQDNGDLAFSLLLPIAIFALMYGAFGDESLFHGTAYIVNEDREGAYSALLIERLRETENLEVDLLSSSKANSKLDSSDVLLVTYIPEGFSARLASRWPAQLVFRQRGNGGQEGQIVSSLVRGTADEISQGIQIERQVEIALSGKGIGGDHTEDTVYKLLEREREAPIIEVQEELIGAEADLANQFLPGIVTMFVLFAITMNSRALVEERRRGTLERLLTTRLTVGQLFTGKFLAGVGRGFVQTLILLVLAYIVFQLFTPASFLTVLLIALIFSAAASALGLIIASVARSEDQATWMSVFFTMATVMLGGTFFEIGPGSPLYTASRASINTYVNDALKTIIASGGTLSDVAPELGVLLSVVLAGLILSRILFRAISGGR
jgi:ABC-2 type transport system permease protein